jgi:ABC-2 type transport system ATP-binding protein
MAPLYVDMKVKEYLRFRAELKGMRGHSMRRRVGEVMELCGLTDVRRRLIDNLSKGYRQRVALADALVHDPKLLILDEPTNGLDPVQIRQVRELLRELRTRHTVLLSTHILHEVEVACDRVIMLNHGRILADDSPKNLAARLNASTIVRLEAETKDEKAAAKLEGIQGVRKCTEETVEGTAWRHFMLRVEPGYDVREAVQALAATEAWRVRELHRELPNLEDVFVELASSAEVMKGGRLS